MILIEIELEGKLIDRVKSPVVPAAGDVISINNINVYTVKRRHWVIDKLSFGPREFRCILEIG